MVKTSHEAVGGPPVDGPGTVVWQCRNPVHPQPCWHGRCPTCRKGVTAFDHTSDDAMAIVAAHALKVHVPQLLPGAALEGKRE